VSPEVVEALKKDPTLLALGGRRRELTILFSDIAGFTRISETLHPEQTVQLLNRYLTTQSREVMAGAGVIDKFVGDAVMAFWGDPLETEDHALRAVKAALRCLAALPSLDPLLRELGLDGFNIRMGLNSGPAIVGNMGSEDRFDYTAMGDNVNLASRLEGANKAFGSRLLIGPVTYLLVKDHVVAKRLADLVVVGRSTPVRVYEVLSLREDAAEDTKAHAAAFGKAHEALRTGDMPAAWEHLAEAEARRPGDGPTAWLRALAGRIRKGEASTPWDGTWRLTEK
jgi:adenylate cyclase